MRPGKRKVDDAAAGAEPVRARAAKRTPAQPGRRSAPPRNPRDLGFMPLSFWFKVAMQVVDKEKWPFWRFILTDAMVQYAEGSGYVLDVVSAPDAEAFNKTGVYRDVRLQVQLQPTGKGGQMSGCSQASKRLGGGWAINSDDADARERTGVVLPATALLMLDLPKCRAAHVWHCAYSHDARGRLTETVSRNMPQLVGLAIAAEQEQE